MRILRPLSTTLLWLLVLLSFTANALLLRLLVDARAQAGEGLRLSAQAVGDLQAAAVDYSLRVDRAVPVTINIPAGTVITTSAGRTTLSEPTSFETTLQLEFDAPVRINLADTPLNPSLLSAKDYLDRLYVQWQRDPLQVFLAPLP
jgi:hypothetical protein